MRLLLVEDNPVDAQALVDMVEGQVQLDLTQVDSLHAMEALGHAEFDLVMLDLSLPDGHGLETVRRAQHTFPATPIVVLTADDDEQTSLEVVRIGAQDYLVKGRFDRDALLRSLRYAVERRHAEELKQRLLHADRLAVVGQLAAGVAHEIANPAAFVLGNLQLLDGPLGTFERLVSRLEAIVDDPDPARTLLALRELLRDGSLRSAATTARKLNDENLSGLDRIRAVTRDLQHYSRIDRAEVVLLDVNALVEETCKLVNNAVRHRARLDVELGEVPEIAADRGRLEQVITNLLVNAAQAIPEGDPRGNRVTVRTELTPAGIVVSVEDTGYGVPEGLRERIFEPFFTTKARGVGTGLGLSIGADIARKHGGVLRCISSPGEGSRFELLLPLDTGLTPPPTHPPSVHPAPAEAIRGRVLIIDDEPAICHVYREFLSMEHEVEVACSGAEAVEHLLGADFDAILCDLMMPDMDGAQLYEWVNQHRPESRDRIVFCSGGLVTERTRQFVASVPNRLLEKPVLIEDLREAIHRLLRAKHGA